ncbi:hypothetical protein BESB_075270 [Besnoitia besnoiti]|uniref:Uncharacterized protein n=1 Tax=Besnoitia besnoiti TaxID=94643 RepID=A0A2A9M8S1_BESBE|nr:uncharacterized protein BESB_075270 [Besnoitia besnoiti]PFH34375.1 hypothetical protein BESB_075270 [Besnoitia besnoiti]
MPSYLCAGAMLCGDALHSTQHHRVCASPRNCAKLTSHLAHPGFNTLSAGRGGAAHNPGSYSNSMAQLACSQSRKTQTWGQGQHGSTSRRGSFASIPPPSLSHQKALQLEKQEKATHPRETTSSHHHLNGKLHDLVDAIRHPRSHSTQCVRISTSSLHIGECPEVPEHTATFALKRTGMLKWQEAAGEEEEDEKEKELSLRSESPRERKTHGVGKNHSAPNLLRKTAPHSPELTTRPTPGSVAMLKELEVEGSVHAESVASTAPSLASTSSYLSGLAALSGIDSDASAPSPRKAVSAPPKQGSSAAHKLPSACRGGEELRRVDTNSPTTLSASSLIPSFGVKKGLSWNKLKERLRKGSKGSA